jgi:hypothetical protein
LGTASLDEPSKTYSKVVFWSIWAGRIAYIGIAEDGNIALMGRKPIQNQTPDLFSPQAGASPNEAAEASRRLSRQPALPKDLPRAIRHLADIELDWLVRTAIQEAKRRGRPVPTDAVAPAQTDTAATSRERQTRQGQIGHAAALTQGQVNVVRAAFKAGVPPRRIGRQFGLSQAQVRKALSILER